MRINAKGKARDDLRKQRRDAIAERQRVVAGEPLKQHYPCYGEGKLASVKGRNIKHGERRRVSMALHGARGDHEAVIAENPRTSITKLARTAYHYAT